MNIDIEIELNEEIYTVEAYIIKGEDSSHDYPGSAPEIDCMTVYDEQGCDITRMLDYDTIEYIEDSLFDIYYER